MFGNGGGDFRLSAFIISRAVALISYLEHIPS